MYLHGETHCVRNWIPAGFVAIALAILSAQSSAQTISCSSDDMHRHFCPTGTRGEVRIVKQNSDSPCQQGYSWGYDHEGIWVDHGCRADFVVDPYRYEGADQGNVITCSSDDMHWHSCPIDMPGEVRMVKQRSDSPCQQGYSWGYGREGIWVDHGCRADFVVDPYRYEGPEQGNMISCSSDDMHRHSCPLDTRGEVRMVRQKSESPCQQGYSWGYDREGIWVDHGCRADFVVERRRYRRPDHGSTVSCSSDDMHRHSCPMDTRGGVRMVRQNSGSPCQQGYSWGYDREGIWVDHGCRADFQSGEDN